MVTLNNNVTVVTVTLNNVEELTRTLKSLTGLATQPYEIIIIDGGSSDGSVELIESFNSELPQIKYLSEKDDGIFDVMNKGKALVKTKLIHYLTAGDFVFGEPYQDIIEPCLIPIEFIGEDGSYAGRDRIKLFGTAYNHQGLIVAADHEDYDTRLWIGGDYKMSLQAFPKGLTDNLILSSGGVKYQLGGLSTQRTFTGTLHMIRGIFMVRPVLAVPVSMLLLVKLIIPRAVRRLILRALPQTLYSPLVFQDEILRYLQKKSPLCCRF